MLTKNSTMKTEAIFSEDRQRRYLLLKEWDITKPKATIIMTNPSSADILAMDYTTLYILNNLVKLDFGSVEIVNLTSKPTVKLNAKEDIAENLEAENIEYIIKSAEKSDNIIIAWGRLGNSNNAVKTLQDKLLEHLKPFKDKLYQICDDNGECGFHPLAPSIRFVWHLSRYEISTPPPPSEKSKSTKKSKNKKLQKNAPADLPIQESNIQESKSEGA